VNQHTISKSVAKVELQDHIRYVAQAETKHQYNDIDIAATLDLLTPRETEVLTLISKGFKDQAIANDLGITVGTVKKHVGNILSKLKASSRTHAAVIAEKNRLL
jgi:DNA-binding NarL/FixJ family response regulator